MSETPYSAQTPHQEDLDSERLVNRQVIAFARKIVADPDAILVMCAQSFDKDSAQDTPKPPVWGESELRFANDVAWGLTRIGYHRRVKTKANELNQCWELILDGYSGCRALYMLPDESAFSQASEDRFRALDELLSRYWLVRRSSSLGGAVVLEGSSMSLARFEHQGHRIIRIGAMGGLTPSSAENRSSQPQGDNDVPEDDSK